MMKKAFFIITPIIGVMALIFVFGVLTINSKYTDFQSSGHIIAKSDKASTTKYYFDTNSKYKTVGDKVIINDKNNKEIEISNDNFIHYSDGSISTFKKSAVLDLNDLSKKNYKYYNIFEGGIFVKSGNGYNINYLDKRLKFNSFLLKISDNKFMIVGKNIKLDIDNNKKEIKDSYLEVTYLEGNLLKVENQSVAFQSISDNVTISLDGNVIIDFGGKNIYKDSERKLSLGEITIDSDDNIEINTKDNENITGSKDDKNKKDGSSSNTKNENNSNTTKTTTEEEKYKLPDMSTGIVDTSEDTIEEVVDANARVADPEFKIVNMMVTANRIQSEIQVVDTAVVLQGDVNVKIVEADTNKVVFEKNEEYGKTMIEVDTETLTPETNYILILNSDYKKNDVTYNKDFVQKTFITDAIGVELEKYFVSSNQLSVNLKKNSYSTVTRVDVALEDANEQTLKTETVDLTNEDNIIEFDDLKNDTLYKVRVYNFAYEDSAITNTYTILKKYETLKRKPTISGTSYTVDKREGKFNMMLNNVVDSDGAITSYKYEVYDARTASDPNATPITTVEKTSSSSASVKIDGKNIVRGNYYVFRVVMTFNDNEKEYEIVTDFSEVMHIEGVTFPTVRFNKTEVTFERIVGEIEITDEANTIDIANGSPITITYTDSVGNSNSFTSTGTYKIPINVNNLRSNETYSFAVTAKVDLQDNNPPIDSCYIGSVIVVTEDPNPFKMEYENIDDAAYAFSFNAHLTNGSEGNAELEANTLTGVTFNLYAGKNTSGRLVKTIKNVDRDPNPYISELRDSYYDKQFRIDPTFFGVKNSDLTSEYYTIEVTSAYDYTTFKNNLPISNNTITVKTENFLPDMPANPEDSVEVIPIYNRDQDSINPDLDRGTVVGYHFRASFDNSKKYAKKITYVIHDAITDAVVKTINYSIPETGDIDYCDEYLLNGLVEGQTDGKLRRGRSFYISYTIDLDTNYDGNTDIVYPLSGKLRSTNVSPNRQEAKFAFYPSTSTTTLYTWKYTYDDIDHTLTDKTVYGKIDGTTIGTQTLQMSNQYNSVNFNLNKAGFFTITGKYVLVDGDESQDVTITRQYYEGVKAQDFGKVKIYPDKNRIIFSFVDYNNKIDLFNKISAVKIDFVTSDKTITLDGLSARSGNITINYSEIEELMGKNITPRVTLYYDSGIYGFDTEGSLFALQQIRFADTDATYYYTFEGNRFNTVDAADGSYIDFNLKLNENKLVINDKKNNTNNEYNIFVSSYGIAYNDTYVSPKKLNSITPTIDGTQTFKFNTIIPGISILNSNGISNIKAYVASADLKFSTYGVDNKLRDDKISVELYSYEENVSDAELVNTLEYSLNNFKNGITIDSLNPDTNYYVKVFGYVKDSNDQYVKTYLYDVDQLRDGVNYYFKTIGNIGINNIRMSYAASSYSQRYLVVKYDLSETIGVSYIKYKVYKKVGNDRVLMTALNPPNTTSRNLKEKDTIARILIPNTSGFNTGNTYIVEIIPVYTSTNSGNTTEVELQSAEGTYSFKDLYKPYFSVNQTFAGTKLIYRVNVRDYHKTIVNGKYRIQILDSAGNDITPNRYKDTDYNIRTINQTFELDNAVSTNIYTLLINYSYDVKNNASTIQEAVYSINSNSAIDGTIDLGNVYADTDSYDNTKVNLSFFDSDKLTDAKYIVYSIYNDGESIDSNGEEAFLPISQTSGDTNYYTYQLAQSVSRAGIYYIAMQFLDRDKDILAETTVEYRLLN